MAGFEPITRSLFSSISSHENGPVTRAIAAMNTEAPARRSILGAFGAALTGTIIGVTPVRSDGPDLTLAAEEYLREAAELGVWFTVDTRTGLWCGMPVSGTLEQKQARNALREKLNDRPRLRQAVIAAACRNI